LIAREPGLIGGLVGGLVLLKLIVLVILGSVFKLSLDQNLLFSFALAQGGEFGFVLFSFASQYGVLDDALIARLVAVVAVSMAMTPLLMLASEKLLLPLLGTQEKAPRAEDEIDETNPVIIAGFGRFGHVVGRLLLANGVGTTVLDLDSDQVDLLRKLGLKVFYGDAARSDLLRAAGAEKARVLIVAVEDPEKTLEIVRAAQEHFPHLRVLCRARGRPHAYDLLEAGVQDVYRETLDTSLRVGVDTLCVLGYRRHQALRAARKFRRHDEDSVRELAGLWKDRRTYIVRAREIIRSVEKQIRSEVEGGRHPELDAAWDASSMLRQRNRKDGGV
jgi:voltage-gated potassium channel Kch